jgi:hypothetical protein
VNTAGIGAGTTIAPNAAPTSFSLKYKPINYGPDTGAFVLNVTQNGTAVDYVITLRGRGDAAGLNTNVFIQDANPKADILLIVDDSCSMSDKQQALATNFSAFIAYAERANVDYQIGVTTTDQWSNTRKGRLIGNASNPKILKRSTSNVQSLFQAKVNVGIMGSPDERFGGSECSHRPTHHGRKRRSHSTRREPGGRDGDGRGGPVPVARSALHQPVPEHQRRAALEPVLVQRCHSHLSVPAAELHVRQRLCRKRPHARSDDYGRWRDPRRDLQP